MTLDYWNFKLVIRSLKSFASCHFCAQSYSLNYSHYCCPIQIRFLLTNIYPHLFSIFLKHTHKHTCRHPHIFFVITLSVFLPGLGLCNLSWLTHFVDMFWSLLLRQKLWWITLTSESGRCFKNWTEMNEAQCFVFTELLSVHMSPSQHGNFLWYAVKVTCSQWHTIQKTKNKTKNSCSSKYSQDSGCKQI